MSGDILYCRTLPDWMSDPSLCLFEWQTLVGGLLAVAAAAISVFFLRKQISQSEQHRQDELDRRHNAVRATVPLALAAVSDFCDAITSQITVAIEDRRENSFDTAFEANASGRVDQRNFDPVEIPSEVIATMQAFIESLSAREDVKHMAELLASLQVLQSRFNGFKLTDVAVNRNLYGLLLDTAKIKLLTDNIYNYARFVDDGSFALVNENNAAESWRAILGKAHGLVFTRPIPDIFFPMLNEIVKSHQENQISPWNERFE